MREYIYKECLSKVIVAGIYQGQRANAALIHNGSICVAAEKERLTRKKHDDGVAEGCLNACKAFIGIKRSEIDAVAFVGASEDDHPYGYNQVVFSNKSIFPSAKSKQFLFPQEVYRVWPFKLEQREVSAYVVDHHVAHAASAYFASPFDSSLIIAYDGWGDFHRNCLISVGQGLRLDPIAFIDLPIGMAFKKISKDIFGLKGHKYDVPGKLMALSAMGTPRSIEAIKLFITQIHYRTNFYEHSINGFGPLKFLMYEDLTDKEGWDFAASVQRAAEELVIDLLRFWKKKTAAKNLCIAGGCAQNVVINRKIAERLNFENIYVVPFSHDGGLGIGAAQYVSSCIFGLERREALSMPYLGPTLYSSREIEETLRITDGIKWSKPGDLGRCIAERLAKGSRVALFQGRSEVGPRALGNRSLLADSRFLSARDAMNHIKMRESFRPFAAAVPAERAAEYFDWPIASPHMTFAVPIKDEAKRLIPAVVHADGTCRIQTVTQAQNQLLHAILTEFGRITNVPVLLNTSLNFAGDPIAETLSDAFMAFIGADIDTLVANEYLIEKG